MVEFLLRHWLVLLLAATAAGLLIRSRLRVRARRRQMEAWAAERRRQREREEREEEERRQRAQALAAARLCRTEEELARALGNALAEITIEGRLAQTYTSGASGLAELVADYQIVLARHGKVVLRRGAARSTASTSGA
jgi:hypothetical protein